MVNTRGRKIGRDILARRTRTALVCASIFISVLGVVTLVSMGEILVSHLENAIRQERLPMIRTYVTPTTEEGLAETGYLDALRALPEIEQVQGIALYPVYWKLPGAARFNEGRIFGHSEPLEALTLEPVGLVAGRWPVAGQREIAVERRLASRYGLEPGDTLTVRVLSSAGESGGPHEENWTVVGTVFQPYQYPTLPGAPTAIPANTMLFAQWQDVRTITNLQGFNLVQARYTDFATAQAQSSAFQAAIASQTPYVPAVNLLEDPAKNSLIEQARLFRRVLSILAVVSLVVSGFLVLNVINALVIEQRRQIGVMKALGATGWDNFVMYAGIALIYGIIGTIPGVLLGIPLGFKACQAIAPQINLFLDEFDYSLTAIVLGAVLGVLVPVIAAIPPVLFGIRVTILEAITDLGIDTRYTRGPLARLVDVVPLPVALRQSLRNVLRKKGRLVLTMITLALAAGAFMGVFANLATLNGIIDNTLGQINIDISFTPHGMRDYAALQKMLRDQVSGLKAVEPGTTLAVDIDGYTPRQLGTSPAFLIAVGINPASPDITHFKLTSGRAWEDDPNRSGVVLAAVIADALGKTAGDDVTLRVGGRAETFEILGVSTYSFNTLWMRWDDLSRLGGLVENAPTPNRYLTSIEVDGSPVTALGVDNLAGGFLTFEAGEFLTPGEPGAIISAPLAARRGYAVGDTLTLAAGSSSIQVPVTGIFTIPPQLAGPGRPEDVIALDWTALAALEGISLDGSPVPSAIQIVLDQDEPTPDEVADKMSAINELLLAQGINASYTNWAESSASLIQLLNTAGAVLNTAAALLAAVGAIGLLSVLSMSVFERQKEIGVMRSIGASSRSVAGQFLVEGLIVGVLAWGAGIPLGYGLSSLLIHAMNFEHAAGQIFPPTAIALGLVGTLGMATIASLWPSITAARKTVSDILRYQ